MTRTLIVTLALLTPGLAWADYEMPVETERLLLQADRWQLEGTTLTLTDDQGVAHAFGIDLFWLADRVCSDAVCVGDYEAEAKAYLVQVGQATREVSVCKPMGEMRVRMLEEVPALLRVELVRTEGVDGLFVAGVWVDDGAAFERASQWGYCPRLRLSGEEFAALDAESYAARLQELHDAAWQRIRAKN